MKRKIGIIGMGYVGSSIAISLLHSGLPDELVLYDKKEALAEGEALDLAQGAAFYSACSVRFGRPEEMLDAEAVVITAGRGGKPGESRLDLLQDNVRIIEGLAKQLQKAKGLLVMVSNPVDVMTYVAQKASGLPIERVIGTGTMLDTARLRQIIGRELHLEPRTIHAQLVGEHGDSEVVLWSSAQIGGVALRKWKSWDQNKEKQIAQEVRTAAQEIIKRKGATNHAIGLVTASLLNWALRGAARVLTVSRVQTGAFGLKDVALSLPSLVGSGGAEVILEPEISQQESAALQHSSEVLKKAISSISG